MPLNRPPLALGQGPRGVQDARRWVGDLCAEIGRPELAECAQLGVSELVTNALLHGEPPITVRVRGTKEHPRVEVRDSSVEPPILPTQPLDRPQTDDLLLTFGRGLSIVARCSSAWGAEIEEDGKVVWFAPVAEFADGPGVPGAVTGTDRQRLEAAPTKDRVRITILGVPLSLYLGFQQHFRELRREVRLLALAHQDTYPLAKALSDLFGSLDRQLRDGIGVEQIEDALTQGMETTDLVVHMPRAGASTLMRFVELLDLADAFCREERLLSLARNPEQRRFQNWFLTEFVRQARGEAPLSWLEARSNGRANVVG
ncbi:MAG TPA: ATP-binding protein [Nocardioides sp.]|uniref:ATP-binding protein n=1 Tax=Nocardioides sp. TaxID=35761 RepID=UPI002E3765BA|nr:ATP-binding protein [Nocardioides sp.]HEX5088076.1 ATP-binding protein [Nocardioides sp.]